MNKETSDSYFRSRDIDTARNAEMLNEVGRMLQCSTGFKHIKSFLELKLGKSFALRSPSCANADIALSDKNLTAQQARNVISMIDGKQSSTTRLSILLDRFAAINGNHVLLVQDQIDITTIIALQSNIQKQCFDEWGGQLGDGLDP